MKGNPTLVEVMSYLPQAIGSETLLLERQNTTDLAKAIAESHQENLKYAKKIAFLFRGDDDFETCKNIYNFIKKYIPYDIEPGERQCTKTIPRILDDARNGIGSDCKMYSVFTGTILKCLNIPFKYRLAGYQTNYPQHIYCVTDRCVIDAVLPYFNHEKKPYKYQKDMALYNLAGVDQIGKTKAGKKIDAKFQKVKEKAKEVLNKSKVVAAAVPRNAFLLILEVNARGIATGLKKLISKNPGKVENFWKQWGGDFSALKNVVEKGASKKPLFGSKVSGVDQIGMDPATITAALATAAPIIIAIVKAMKSEGIPDADIPPISDVPPPPSGTGYDTQMPSGERSYSESEKEKVSDKMAQKAAGEPKQETGGGINQLLLFGVGAAVLLMFKN